MHFLSLSNTDVKFAKQLRKFTWRSYTVIEVLPITNSIELINKKEFSRAILVKNLKTFIVYIAALEVTQVAEMVIYSL